MKMFRTYFFLSFLLIDFLPLMSQKRSGQTELFEAAIEDFIREAGRKYKRDFDTLFIGLRTEGKAEDAARVKLPASVSGKPIVRVKVEEAEDCQKTRATRYYINLIYWIKPDEAEFIFVMFTNGFVHQFDFKSFYLYSKGSKSYVLDRSVFSYTDEMK